MAFVTRLIAAAIGTRVASATGEYGVWGAAAGVLVTSAVLRWPGKAVLVGVAWGVSRFWTRPRQVVRLLEDHTDHTPEPLLAQQSPSVL